MFADSVSVVVGVAVVVLVLLKDDVVDVVEVDVTVCVVVVLCFELEEPVPVVVRLVEVVVVEGHVDVAAQAWLTALIPSHVPHVPFPHVRDCIITPLPHVTLHAVHDDQLLHTFAEPFMHACV